MKNHENYKNLCSTKDDEAGKPTKKNIHQYYSERNHCSPTRQKREEKKIEKYVCVKTRQSGDRTS